MYDYARPASLGTRDVIAAWLVCLAVVDGGFRLSRFLPGTSAGGASRFEKRRPGGFADRVVRELQRIGRGTARLTDNSFFVPP